MIMSRLSLAPHQHIYKNVLFGIDIHTRFLNCLHIIFELGMCCMSPLPTADLQ